MKLQEKSKENETKENSNILNIITIIISLSLAFLFLVVPKVSLKKGYNHTININSIFDNNLQVKSFFQSINSNNFTVLNNIDNTKIGDYNITYLY